MWVFARAPNRILDLGGWTDTHFAGSGKVLNFAVSLFARVIIKSSPEPGIVAELIDYEKKLHFKNLAELSRQKDFELVWAGLKRMGVEKGIQLSLSSDLPPGAGTGGSASVSVALLLALARLQGKVLNKKNLAQLAHQLEVEDLKRESGVQDQISASYGGINFIEINPYPNFQVFPLHLPFELLFELENSLLLVYDQKGHQSSEVHKKVIARLKERDSEVKEILKELANCAKQGKTALERRDLEEFSRWVQQNHQLQKSLHPEISTPNFEEIEKLAFEKGARAVKINGAGGGGSMSIIIPPPAREKLKRELIKKGYQVFDFTLAMEPARAILSREKEKWSRE